MNEPYKRSTTPLISIITVSRNNLAGLRRTYESLDTSLSTLTEWIVIDGASNDGSQDFLNTTHADYLSEADNGIYDAMNKGITRAKGQYLYFLNAGDQLANDTIMTRICDEINARIKPPAFIYGDAWEEDLQGHTFYKSARSFYQFDYGMITHHQAMLYRRPDRDHLYYDTKYQIAADYDFTLRFLALNSVSNDAILKISAPICIFEPGGVSQIHVKTGRCEQFDIRKRLQICSSFRNMQIYYMQTMLMWLRYLSPNTYWKLRKYKARLPFV